ncbi:MAG: methyltransferase domain-containing protein [Candidatus Electrothrix sp. EH2]|nr:methyltransferase domain-containing protein [Candidatus Electrothrix sp. EH2]
MVEYINLCPLCGSVPSGKAFPYTILFENIRYDYLKCSNCKTVYVSPLPTASAFAHMYAKAKYHDCHYIEGDKENYNASIQLLSLFAHKGGTILDYGCGFGSFLNAAKIKGFSPVGVEFDVDAAQFAEKNTNCKVYTVQEFQEQQQYSGFDIIHFGDVLEHLPDPVGTLKQVLAYLKPGGLLFVEGPLEVNTSPVYWAAKLYGLMKHFFRPGFIGAGKPTHLFHTGEKQQLAFFRNIEPWLQREYWRVYETGWPYSNGGIIKRIIASIAIWFSGRKLFGLTFGNRFSGVFVKKSDNQIGVEQTVIS